MYRSRFCCHGWPSSPIREPVRIDFTKSFENAVKAAFELVKPPLKRHHALDDAIANRYAFNLLRNDNAKKKK